MRKDTERWVGDSTFRIHHSAFPRAHRRGWRSTIAAALAVTSLVIVLCWGIANYSYKAPAVVIGIGVGGLILWNPFIGLLVVVLSLPFETIGMLGDPGAPGAVSLTKISGLMTCAAVIFDILLRRRPLAWRRLFNRLSLLVVLLAAVTTAAAIIHPSEESFKETVRFFTIVVFFFVILHLTTNEARVRHIVFTWVITGTLVSVYSLIQRRFGATVGSEDWSPIAGTVIDVSEQDVGVMVRTAGTFTHPAWLALYLSLTIPLTLYMLWSARRALHRTLWTLAAVIQAVAIFYTHARMGYLGMVLGVVLFLIRRRGGTAIVLWAVLVTAATYPLWPTTFQTRVESILDYTSSESSRTRIGQQLVGLWMFRDHPVTGVGPGNFEENVKRYTDRVPDRWRVEVIGAHNLYVEVLAELGVQGLVVLLLILVYAWRAAQQLRRRAPTTSTALLYEAMGASLLVFAFSAFFVHAQYQKEWWLLLAVITAACSMTHADSARSDQRTQAIGFSPPEGRTIACNRTTDYSDSLSRRRL